MSTATLTTLTPVHIGSGQKMLRDFDFIEMDKQIGFVDMDKMAAYIGIENISKFTAIIEAQKTKGKQQTVTDFLKTSVGKPGFRLENVCSRIATITGSTAGASELKEQYFTALQGPCLPGSSIKGAVKTAIWKSLVTNQFINSLNEENIRNKKGKWDDGFVDGKLFGNEKAATEKSTRFLRIGDCQFNNLKTEIYRIGIYSLSQRTEYIRLKGINKETISNIWNFKPETFLAEVIPSLVTAKLEIKLDSDLLRMNITRYPGNWQHTPTQYLSSGIQAFCKLVNEYTSQQIGYEVTDLKEYEFENKPEGQLFISSLEAINKQISTIQKNNDTAIIFRLGGNSGWSFMTGSWIKEGQLLANLSDYAYENLRNTIQPQRRMAVSLWPKTRKMTTSGVPLGFVKISF